jgi:hypothetical protein
MHILQNTFTCFLCIVHERTSYIMQKSYVTIHLSLMFYLKSTVQFGEICSHSSYQKMLREFKFDSCWPNIIYVLHDFKSNLNLFSQKLVIE